MDKFDPRIVIFGIEVDGQLKKYKDLFIHAKGTKFANANQNECEVEIRNLDKQTRDYLVTETSPFNLNRSPKIFTLEAGRESTGATLIYKGTIASATFKKEAEGDITCTIKALTANHKKGDIVAVNGASSMSLSNISKQAAGNLGLNLNFQATDKTVSNYAYSGGALGQVDSIGDLGDVDAYVDDDEFVVKDSGAALSGEARELSASTGMVGIPELTEKGVSVKFLLDGTTKLGGAIIVQSEINPGANGTYTIFKLGFDIANRDTPFYWIAEGKRRQ